MGVFKDIRTLTKQAKEIDKTYDPGAQMRAGRERMQQMNGWMAQQTEQAGLATTGTPAQATITSTRDTGTLVNYQPVLELDLLVLLDGRPPFPVQVQTPVGPALLHRAVPGATVVVRVDPSDPRRAYVDWTAVPS
jgi:hypothetical protein